MSDGPPEAGGTSDATIGPYEIVSVLERSDRETIYLGIAPTSEREVAIRVSSDGDAARAGDRFAASAIAQSLVHRHILRVFDAGEHDGLAYVVEEVRRGRTLAEILRDSPDSLDLATRIDIVAQVCSGLHYAHERGLIHGEVKPANVFVASDGVVKLLNLGVNSTGEMTMVSDNALSGTFEYMAPEQLMGRDDVDCRCDIFSASVLLYELISGRLPFKGPNPAVTLTRILSNDPPPLVAMPQLDAIVRRGLAKDPTQRFASAQELAYALWTFGLPGNRKDDEEPASKSETVHLERGESLDDQGTVMMTPEPQPASRLNLVYAGIAAALVVISVIILLRGC